MRDSRAIGLVVIWLVVSGCAGSRPVVDSIRARDHDGRIVESVTLRDDRVVTFDAWNSAGPGRDRRARIRDGAVVGYVDGTLRTIALADVQQLQLGANDSAGMQAATIVALAAGVGVVVGLVILYSLGSLGNLN